MTTWFWLTDLGFPADYPWETTASQRKKVLQVGRILKEIDGHVYSDIDRPTHAAPGAADTDEAKHKTPLQSWTVDGLHHIFARSLEDPAAPPAAPPPPPPAQPTDAAQIDLVLGAYVSGANFYVAFAGGRVREASWAEYWNKIKNVGWGASLRDKIVDYFTTRTNAQTAQNTVVNNVTFKYRYGNVLSELLVKFLLTDTTYVTNPVVTPVFDDIIEIKASLKRGNTLY